MYTCVYALYFNTVCRDFVNHFYRSEPSPDDYMRVPRTVAERVSLCQTRNASPGSATAVGVSFLVRFIIIIYSVFFFFFFFFWPFRSSIYLSVLAIAVIAADPFSDSIVPVFFSGMPHDDK